MMLNMAAQLAIGVILGQCLSPSSIKLIYLFHTRMHAVNLRNFVFMNDHLTSFQFLYKRKEIHVEVLNIAVNHFAEK